MHLKGPTTRHTYCTPEDVTFMPLRSRLARARAAPASPAAPTAAAPAPSAPRPSSSASAPPAHSQGRGVRGDRPRTSLPPFVPLAGRLAQLQLQLAELLQLRAWERKVARCVKRRGRASGRQPLGGGGAPQTLRASSSMAAGEAAPARKASRSRLLSLVAWAWRGGRSLT